MIEEFTAGSPFNGRDSNDNADIKVVLAVKPSMQPHTHDGMPSSQRPPYGNKLAEPRQVNKRRLIKHGKQVEHIPERKRVLKQ